MSVLWCLVKEKESEREREREGEREGERGGAKPSSHVSVVWCVKSLHHDGHTSSFSSAELDDLQLGPLI